MFMAPPPGGDLQYRYLDWCSAKVAERFQELSLDEIWERAHRADPQLPSHPPTDLRRAPEPDHPGYLELVRRLSVQLATELQLPSFAEWSEKYRRDPEAFDRELLGFGDRRILEEPTR